MPLHIDNKFIESFRNILAKANKVVILSHMNPDGDAVGSLLGTLHLLRKVANPQASIVAMLPNVCPETFRYLPSAGDIIDAENNLAECGKQLSLADLILCVDLNNAARVGVLKESLEQSRAVKMLVDHHVMPDEALFHHILSMPDLSSACELTYWLAIQAWGTEILDCNIARCLYNGICTDTGSFAYSCESPTLYEAVGELMRFPINAAEVHNRIFNTFSVNRMRLLGFCISERLRVFESEKFAYFYLSAADQKRFSVLPGDLEIIVNYTLMMRNIEVGAFVKESPEGTVRISFRSKYDFDVNQFARTHFNGGGHVKAAGATSPYPFDETVSCLEVLLHQSMQQASR